LALGTAGLEFPGEAGNIVALTASVLFFLLPEQQRENVYGEAFPE